MTNFGISLESLADHELAEVPQLTPYMDNSATWNYWNNSVDTEEQGIPEEWVWERLRIVRDHLLASCDWRIVADATWEQAPWLAYRKCLRDLPNTTTDPRKAIWPIAPH